MTLWYGMITQVKTTAPYPFLSNRGAFFLCKIVVDTGWMKYKAYPVPGSDCGPIECCNLHSGQEIQFDAIPANHSTKRGVLSWAKIKE